MRFASRLTALSRTTPPTPFRPLLALATAVLSTACGSDALTPPMDIEMRVEGELVLTPSVLTLVDGDAGALRLSLRTPQGAELTSFPNSGNVSWRSSAPANVSVAAGGTVTGRLPGQSRISATLGTKTVSALVIVDPRPGTLRPMSDGVEEGVVGATLADSVGIRVVDRGGLPVAGVTVRFRVELGDGEVSPAEAVTRADGSARFAWKLGAEPGDNAVAAEVAGVPTVYLRATGKASKDRLRLRLLSGDDQVASVDEVLTSELRVQVEDEHGNPVPGAPVRWEFVNGSVGGASVASGGAAAVAASANASGVSGVRWRLGQQSGDQRAVARLDGGYEVWFKARAKPSSPYLVQMEPQALDLGVNERATLDVTVRDRFGNELTSPALTWSTSDRGVVAVDDGIVRGVAAGAAVVEAHTVDGNRMAATSISVLSSGGPASLRAVSGQAQSAPVGQTLPEPLVVEVRDAGGQPLAGISVNWTVASGTGIVDHGVTATDGAGRASVRWTLGSVAGSQQVVARAGGLPATTFVASATAGAVAEVRVTPSTASLSTGESRSFVATAVDAAGNPVPAAGMQWSSSASAVATVDASGQVRAVAPGAATIRASLNGVTGQAAVTVASSVSRVAITPTTPTFSALGQTIQLQGKAYDAQGVQMPTTGLTWTSRATSIASVDALGRVVSKALGRATVVACLVSACDSVTVEVNQMVAQVAVSPSTQSIPVGGSVQFSATAKDPGGSPIPGVSFAWTSANPQVVAVDGSGRATGLTAGSSAVLAAARVSGPHVLAGPVMTGQGALTVTSSSTPPPPPPPAAGAPELPRTYVNTTYQAPTGGRTIRVRQGDNLQSAINQAQRGDILMLDAGATFNGDFELPAKPGSGWIVITTNTPLPAQGTRVTPTSAASFAKIVGQSSAPALWVRAGASQYRIMGVEIGLNPSIPLNYHVVRVGESGGAQNTLANVPSDIILDRVYIHGAPNQGTKRCVELNASPSAVVDSWLGDCHFNGADAQAILAWNAPGPFKIVNNHLEGSGETVMFGGADPSIANLVPSDIEIRHNHFYRPPSWQGKWTVKNHFELKMARRVVFEGNILENTWKDAQVGFAIIIKTANQSGAATWAVTEHITMRYNVIRNHAQGINISERVFSKPSGSTNNILIAHNVIDQLGGQSTFGGEGILFQVLDHVDNLTIENNTGIAQRATMIIDGQKGIPNFTFRNNIVTKGQYGVFGSGAGEGSQGLNTYMAPGYVFSGNVIVGADASRYPSGNHFPANLSQVGFVNASGLDYRLTSGSPYAGKGADFGQVSAQTAGVN
ncbi:MAG: Ig-like domain-containing protein [Gemmatimonadetes bacterium]|nr:Ig-like domain-containing protein [Gemmatimonadota bacterium]